MNRTQRPLLAALAPLLFLLFAVASPPAPAQTRTYMAYVGSYASGTAYNVNDVVLSSGIAYVSTQSVNQGNTPATSPSYWTALGSASSGGTITINGQTCTTGGSCAIPVFLGSGSSHATGIVPDPGATAGTTHYLREDGSWAVPPAGTVSSLTTSGTSGAATLSGGILNIPQYSGSFTLTTSGTSGAATYSGGVLNIPQYTGGGSGITAITGDITASGTGSVSATLATVNANVGSYGGATTVPIVTVNAKGLVTAVTTATITAAPPTDIRYYPAAVCDGGTSFAASLTRYDNQQPQSGCFLPSASVAAYLAFNYAPTLPQYAQMEIATPTYWTGTSLYVKFAGTATTGNVGWIVDTACRNDGTVPGAETFGTATTVTTSVSGTSGASVTSAIFSNIGVSGTNGCSAGTTTPGSILIIRIHRSASDTQTGNANLMGVVLVTGRSQ